MKGKFRRFRSISYIGSSLYSLKDDFGNSVSSVFSGCSMSQIGSFLVLLVIVCLRIVVSVSAGNFHWDYCIIGAGPSGLQLGWFLESANRDYVIFERTNISGKKLNNQ